MLCSRGYRVCVAQNPTTSLADDVAATCRIIAAQQGKVILVGHSYGGVVITEAGHDPRVCALVYVAAFAPDAGECVATLLAKPPAGSAVPPILAPKEGFLTLDSAKFATAFAADVAFDVAEFMAASQLPWGVEALTDEVGQAAWRTKPSWYLVAEDDKMLSPLVQHRMAARARSTVRATSGSHAIHLSRPSEVARIIVEAAEAVGAR